MTLTKEVLFKRIYVLKMRVKYYQWRIADLKDKLQKEKKRTLIFEKGEKT